MRFLQCSLFLLVVTASLSFARAQSKTDAQMDGFSGPVKSVSSAVAQTSLKWQQPDGPTLVAPIWCRDCEYDPDGAKTKSGQIVEGKFLGETIHLVRDADGHVTERYFHNASTGELYRRDAMGPDGKVEQKVYYGGKLRSRSTYAYDQYGSLSEIHDYDAAGNLVDHSVVVYNKDGDRMRDSQYGPGGQVRWEQIFDPESKTDRFTTFDEFGKAKLSWTVVRGKLTSFWEPADSPAQFGDNFIEPEGEGSFDHFACHNDLSCDVSHVHYAYLDGDKHTPLSAEWRDQEGDLKLAAYFEYEVDSHHNWTTRRVWVWNPELGDRTLSETDTRVIAYWK